MREESGFGNRGAEATTRPKKVMASQATEKILYIQVSFVFNFGQAHEKIASGACLATKIPHMHHVDKDTKEYDIKYILSVTKHYPAKLKISE
jgi:hypothetical protein